jgi:lipoprotein-releasing system ATP-binding protein
MSEDATVQDASNHATAVLDLVGLRRTYHQGTREIHVLDGASATLLPGQAVALVGPSGAGKSTLLHIAGLLETPDAGQVLVNGLDCTKMDDGARTRVRRAEMGFVYQFHQLLPEFSAIENVMIPQLVQGKGERAARERAKELLTGLGLGERLEHRPAELSGGEQQRTAIARALANAPRLLLADEPTGNLDPKTSEHVFGEFIGLIEQTGVAALIATHNMELARRMHRVYRLEGGKLIEVPPETAGR